MNTSDMQSYVNPYRFIYYAVNSTYTVNGDQVYDFTTQSELNFFTICRNTVPQCLWNVYVWPDTNELYM